MPAQSLLPGEAADQGNMLLMLTQPVALLLVKLEFTRQQLLHGVGGFCYAPTTMLRRFREDVVQLVR